MPKFRGRTEEWLDDQRSKQSRGPKKKSGPKESPPLPPEEANGTVAEVFPGQCRVRIDTGGARLCSYRRANVMAPNPDGIRERSPVAVGDRVKITSNDPQSGVVEGICERSNYLARPAPDRDEGMIHVMATNLEAVVAVASTRNPDFSSGLLDRFLVAADRGGIAPVIVITKTDLLPSGDARPWKLYTDLGFELFEVSSRDGIGVDAVRARLKGRKVAFCGHSGVGKTSLLSRLVGHSVGRVGDTSDTGKGRHTTTSAILIEVDDGSAWIDMPGVREFGLVGVTPERLAAHFPELREQPWAIEERVPNAEELEALSSLPRMASYRRILQSLLDGEH